MPDFSKKSPNAAAGKLRLPDPQEVKDLTLELERAESFNLFGMFSRLSGYTESLRKELQLEKNKDKIDLKEYQKGIQEVGKTLSKNNTNLNNTEIAIRVAATTAVVAGGTVITGGILGGTIASGALSGVIAGSTAVIGSTGTAIAAGTALGTIAGMSGNIVEAVGHLARGNKTSTVAIQDALDQTVANLQATATASAGMVVGMGFAGKILGPITSLAKKVLFGGLTSSGQAVSSQLMNTGINTASGRENFSLKKLGKEVLQNGIVGLLAGAWGARLGSAREGMKTVTSKGLMLASEVTGDLALGLGSAKTLASLEGREMTFEELANEVSGSIVGSVVGEIGSASTHSKSVDNTKIRAVETQLLLSAAVAKLPPRTEWVRSTDQVASRSAEARGGASSSLAHYSDLIVQTLDKLIDLQSKIEDNQAEIAQVSSSEFAKQSLLNRWTIAKKAKAAEKSNLTITKEMEQLLNTLPKIDIEFFRSETTHQKLLKKINSLATSRDNVFCQALADRLLTDNYQWALANPKDAFSKTIFAMAEFRIEIRTLDNATLQREYTRPAEQLVNEYSIRNNDPEMHIINALYIDTVKVEESNIAIVNESPSVRKIKSEIHSPGTNRDLNIFEKMTLQRCKNTKEVYNMEYPELLKTIARYSLAPFITSQRSDASRLSSKEVRAEIAEAREKLKDCVEKGNPCGCHFDPDIEKSIRIAIDGEFKKDAETMIEGIYDLKRLDTLFESFYNQQHGSATKEFEPRFKEFQEKIRVALPKYESLLKELRSGNMLPREFEEKVGGILPEHPKVFKAKNPFVLILRQEIEGLKVKFENDRLNNKINQSAYTRVIRELDAQANRIIKELNKAWNENRAYSFLPVGELVLRSPN